MRLERSTTVCQPWQQNLSLSLIKEFRPFPTDRRYLQLRAEAFNAFNHVNFDWNPQFNAALFSTAPPVTRTGLSLAGPIAYYPGTTPASFKPGTKEAVLAQYFNGNFGGFLSATTAPDV